VYGRIIAPKKIISYFTYLWGRREIDCRNFRGISILSSPYKILSTILLERLIQFVNGTVRNYQSGLRCNRLSIYKTLCIRRIGPKVKVWNVIHKYTRYLQMLFIENKRFYIKWKYPIKFVCVRFLSIVYMDKYLCDAVAGHSEAKRRWFISTAFNNLAPGGGQFKITRKCWDCKA
jgi:hypothetical protein